MAGTFGDMQTRIASELDRSDLGTPIKDAIVSAIDAYAQDRFDWNQRKFGFSTVAGTDEYALPTTDTSLATIRIMQIDQLMITINSGRYDLKPRTIQWTDREKTNSTLRGRPAWYAILNQRIRLYPIPDAVYSVDGFGLCDINTITNASASNTTNAWVDRQYGEELIRMRAKADLYENTIRNGEKAAAMLGQAQARYQQLKAALDRQQGVASIQPWY